MSGELPSDPYLHRMQSILNAPIPEQLEVLARWHDSENPSRLALGAIASTALNHIQVIEARNRFLEEMGAECAQDWQKIERLLAKIERIRVAFQALRDGREHASSALYRALAAEFPVAGSSNDGGKEHG